MSSNIRVQRVCLYCNQGFEAKTTVTKFCCDTCAKRAYKDRKRKAKIEVSNSQTLAIKLKPIEEIKAKEFLTVRDVATLLNCSRPTVYSLIERGVIKAANLSERKTMIKRSHLDDLFNNEHNPKTYKPEVSPITSKDYYTLTDIKKLYKISDKALHELIKRNGIVKHKEGIHTYVKRKAIDSILAAP